MEVKWTTVKGANVEAEITVKHEGGRWQREVVSCTVNGKPTKLKQLKKIGVQYVLVIDRQRGMDVAAMMPPDVLDAVYGDELREAAEHAAEQRRIAEDRERRIAEIPGLAGIKAAQLDLEKWNREFERSFDECGGLGVRPRPQYDIAAMKAKYPVAAAYLKAEARYQQSNYAFSTAGKRALDRIIYHPEEFQAALDEMEAEISRYVEEHIWD